MELNMQDGWREELGRVRGKKRQLKSLTQDGTYRSENQVSSDMCPLSRPDRLFPHFSLYPS